jgi:hypothetical protein
MKVMRTTVVRDPALHPKPAAVVLLLRLLLPPLQRLWRERRRLDLCAMHSNKTLQCKKLPERDCKSQQYGSPERNSLNIVCDVVYDA